MKESGETLARDVMISDPITASVPLTVRDAVTLLARRKVSGLPVVDAEGKLVGVLSEFDMMKQIRGHSGNPAEIFDEPAQYSEPAAFVHEDVPMEELLDRFIQTRFRRLAVVNGDGLLRGLITRQDMIRALYYRAQLGED